MQKHFIFIALFLACIFSFPTYAIKAYPHPITLTQPDGSTLTIRLHGDEFSRFRTTVDGYLIVENTQGFFEYATVDADGNIYSTQRRARNIDVRTNDDVQFLSKINNATNIERVKSATRPSKMKAAVETAPQRSYPLQGAPKSLVILVNFSDKSFVTSAPLTSFSNLLNQSGYSANGATGSARDYFMSASYGKFAPNFDVVGPYTLPNNMAYYGANDNTGEDVRPQQMIIDACAAADAAGLDFTQYDTDNDGIVDNVFVFYAGYNEAEGGPANTVWPHRWNLPNTTTKFDGKVIFDYACTSELRGTSGSNMTGIGVFTHEFGHVLGLPDYYHTAADKATLDDWSIMDAGGYLNNGRTPPTYSAYDRFFLGWLTPEEINTPSDRILYPLYQGKTAPANTNGQAYLLSATTHNMNGANPNPKEFFVLEYRKKTGWDAFIPAEGMLVWHIDYNQTAWDNNSPNNYTGTSQTSTSHMRVYLRPLSGKSTTPGTAFTSGSFTPDLWNGTNINRAITNITKTADQISFKLMGGTQGPSINVAQQPLAFEKILSGDAVVRNINVTASNLTNKLELVLIENNAFDIKLANGTEWVKSLEIMPTVGVVNTSVSVRFNATVAGVQNNQLGFASAGATDVYVSLTGLCIDPTAPIIRPGLVAEQLKFPLTAQGSTAVKTLNIKTTDVMSNLTIALSGANANMFSVSATSISKEQANAGYLLTVSYIPTTAAPHHATLTISGGGLPQPKVIQLLGE